MLERALTTERCSHIIAFLLRKRGWTTARIARVTGTSDEYINRIRARKQSFQLADVEALAKACKLQPHRLVFDSIERGALSREMQELYDLTREEVARHEEFRRVLLRRPARKRRSGTKAA